MADITFHHSSLKAAADHTACPSCGSMAGNKVYQTVAATIEWQGQSLRGIGRTRRCYKCSYKWRTFETSFTALDIALDS